MPAVTQPATLRALRGRELSPVRLLTTPGSSVRDFQQGYWSGLAFSREQNQNTTQPSAFSSQVLFFVNSGD